MEKRRQRKRFAAVLVLLALLLTSCGDGTLPERSAGEQSGGSHTAETANHGTLDTDTDAARNEAVNVENNGGWYVRVGGGVYFRKYGPEALEKMALFGEYLNSATGGESEIVRYDLATHEIATVFPDNGFGKLYWADGGFYLQERLYGGDAVVWYSPDGAETRTIGLGTILGLSDGGTLAVWQNEPEAGFTLYRQGQSIGGFSPDTVSMEYVGITENGLFLMETRYGTEETEGSETDGSATRILYQFRPDTGDLIELGLFPETDPWSDAEVEQFIAVEDQIGVLIGCYAGTGHFLNDYAAVTAVVNQAESLSILDVFNWDRIVLNPDGLGGDGREPGEEDMETGNGENAEIPEDGDAAGSEEMTIPVLPRLVVSEAGFIESVRHTEGELDLDWTEENGTDLILYDGTEWETLQYGITPPQEDGSGYRKVVQSMEYLDGSAYVTVASVHASPVNDIGWRGAYTLLGMEYAVIPAAQGEKQELAYVDHDALLQGIVWMTENHAALLWQETSSDPEAVVSASERAYRIPFAEDLHWDGQFYQTDLPVATDVEPPDYSGYPIPEAVQGEFVCMELNRDGEAAYLTTKAPDALLSILIMDTEEQPQGVSEIIDVARRPSDEDSPQYWVTLTALEENVVLRLEQTADHQSDMEEEARQNGVFLPGSLIRRRILQKGERVALRASLPWYAELRVSVERNGLTGSYVFGEDNYLHREPVNGVFPEITLAGYREAADGLGGSTAGSLAYFTPVGEWYYRDPVSGSHTAAVRIYADETMTVKTAEAVYPLTWQEDSLYAEAWERADLLSLHAEDPDTISALSGMSGGVGDYRMELFWTENEQILYLVQENNGDGALDWLLPDGDVMTFQIPLHRYAGAAIPSPALRNEILLAEVVKVEEDRIWIRKVVQADEQVDGSPIYRAAPYTACVCATASAAVLDTLAECADPAYPMAVYRVEADRNGTVVSLTAA